MSASAHDRPQAAELPVTARAGEGERILWVPIDQLAVGMFIHPLASASVLIARREQINELKETGVSGVFVDLAKSKPGSLPDWTKAAAGIKAPPRAVRAPVIHRCRRAADFDKASQVLGRARAPVQRLMRQARLGKTLEKQEVVTLVGEIAAAVEQNASAIISLARIKTFDSFTYLHSLAVCALMVNFARHLDLAPSDVHELGMAGLLHDVGKTAVDSHILNKPGALTAAEMAAMREHPERGHEMLERGNHFAAAVLDVALHHHEKVDGTGYPHRLSGDSISLPARMAAIADVYDAVTSNRPYKEAWLPAESLADMFTWEGHFDPGLLQTFIRSVGIYPVGSLVRLASERLALVLEQNPADLTRPTVRTFYSVRQREQVTVADVALIGESHDAIVSREDPAAWGFTDWDRTWPELIRLS